MLLKKHNFRILSTQIFSWFLLFLFPHTVWATGWNDYSLPIGDNIAIYRMNAMEYCVGRIEGSLFICSGPRSEYGPLGPLAKYAQNQTSVFARYFGIQPCESHPKQNCTDRNKGHFFIINKEDGRVTGPMDQPSFQQSLIAQRSPALEWFVPKNPNTFLPVVGTFMFLAFSTIYVGWPFSIPGWPLLMLGFGIATWRHVRKRRNPS